MLQRCSRINKGIQKDKKFILFYMVWMKGHLNLVFIHTHTNYLGIKLAQDHHTFSTNMYPGNRRLVKIYLYINIDCLLCVKFLFCSVVCLCVNIVLNSEF